MHTLKKMLIATTMVVTLGVTTSCGNKEKKSETFVGGLPYTLFTLSHLEKGIDYKVKFECKGVPEVYWNSETPTNEKEHTFRFDSNGLRTNAVVLIKGNIDNLQFCDSNGTLLADGNAKISTIIFSNTITKLPEYACYSLEFSKDYNNSKSGGIVYLPASIKTIGKNAFFPRDEIVINRFVCESPSRPSSWDPNWCTIGELARFMSWGFSYYITDSYDMYYIINDDQIHTACYEGNLQYDITDLVIPETFKVNNFTCSVASIENVGNPKETLESVSIPKSIVAIDNGAFRSCVKLKDVKFADEYEYLWFGGGVFQYCPSLETVSLPKGLINIPANAFDGCTSLNKVVIPNTVQTVDSYLFWNIEKDELEIDLTSYDDANQIATCRDILNNCHIEEVTFKIRSPLKEDDFTAKGWPKTDTSSTPKVVWDDGTTLNA